jgi:transcriptional antiterminator Rof (Rho-off)
VTTTDYQPIACGAYDQLEVLAMRRVEVKLVARDEQGREVVFQGRVQDTSIHDGAEFLVLRCRGERQVVRLDRILRIDDMNGTNVWCR